MTAEEKSLFEEVPKDMIPVIAPIVALTMGQKVLKALAKETKEPQYKPSPWMIEDSDSGDPGYYAAFITFRCTRCGAEFSFEQGEYGWYYGEPVPWDYCPICGNNGEGSA